MRFMTIWVFQKGCNIKHFILTDKEECVNFALKYQVMGFNIGDRVHFLHEKGEGTVTEVLSHYKIKVELSEGLEIEVNVSEIAPLKEMPAELAVNGKDAPVKPKTKTSKPHASHVKEVDLHIEVLAPDYYTMTNSQTLNLQLDYFHASLETAIKGHVKKIVFIHGVGNGVLRQSIHDILKRYQGIEYSDGSYQKYGAGATEVRIISRKKAR